ncbi:MarR family winged helix-turn-helix transcriptional regulator [Enterococcus sp. CR-Ec1]|uniref:MarR family winged helix-turn-helix transcriptional regulator n=1 Tax=Enterococcus sp. CR-Ec1 TaxID=2057791 RepID=UPI000C75D889|nr:MarR family transcriptional regulator [Enterococcus sp. CR-Ec1]AUJ87074.1 MarR family transcriptional regulator [Enterococcus sp. CR-Ec1]MEC5340601.1 MarR family transcriptional regulator [Enterococcus casseliflavus]
MEDILREIGSISRMLESIANIEFKEVQLSKGQYIHLVRIFENEGIIPERLAERIKVDRTTLSRAVKKLEENGFILKESDKENKKIKHLYTTAKGKQAVQLIIRENNYSNKVAIQQLSALERKNLAEMLKKIKSSVEVDWVNVKNGIKRDY